MEYWCFRDGFGAENLVLCRGETPHPGPRDVLLQMGAASLNWRDLVVMRGQHGRSVRPPLIPLSDGVGRIAAMGDQVSGLALGDRVMPAFYQHWPGGPPPADLDAGRLGGPLDGVLATARVFPASGVVRVPDHLSDAEAATLPCAGLTAWSALSEPGQLQPGETVLIQGSGGVALIALQLARVMGARVIMTTSGPDRAARLRAMGADEVIDRNSADWVAVARDLTGGIGCDRILDLGGADSLPGAIKAARTGGTIILIGNVTGNRAELFLPLVLTRRLTLHSVSCGSQAGLQALCRAVDQHRLRPPVAATLPFADAPRAFAMLESGGAFGKICISCQPDGAG